MSGFFIYISPGLLDKINGIPGQQFFLISMYLIFWSLYPIVYMISIMDQSTVLTNKEREDAEGADSGTSKKQNEHQYLN